MGQQSIMFWEPPEALAEWLAANPGGLHADHPEHRKAAVVYDATGSRVSGRVRWISPTNVRACVLVRDADGLPEFDADTGEELEEEVNANGWTFRRRAGGPLEHVASAPP